MVEPKFHDYHDLKVDVDVLNLVSLVIGIGVLDFFPLNVMEFTNLIQIVLTYFLESFTVLLL